MKSDKNKEELLVEKILKSEGIKEISCLQRTKNRVMDISRQLELAKERFSKIR